MHTSDFMIHTDTVSRFDTAYSRESQFRNTSIEQSVTALLEYIRVIQ